MQRVKIGQRKDKYAYKRAASSRSPPHHYSTGKYAAVARNWFVSFQTIIRSPLHTPYTVAVGNDGKQSWPRRTIFAQLKMSGDLLAINTRALSYNKINECAHYYCLYHTYIHTHTQTHACIHMHTYVYVDLAITPHIWFYMATAIQVRRLSLSHSWRFIRFFWHSAAC